MGPELTVWVGGRGHRVAPGAAVGRDATAEVRVEHEQVSRRHAEFRLSGDVWSLHDLSSTNGLDLGTGRVPSVSFRPGRTQLWLGPPETSPSIYIDVVAPAPGSGLPPGSATNGVPGSQTNPGHGTDPGRGPAVETEPAAALVDRELAGNVGRMTAVFRPSMPEILIGRAEECDLSIPDPLVSRHHARLQLGPGGGRIVDLGSDNGTYVNGSRVNESALVDGDLVEMGKAQFIVQNGQLAQHVAHGLPLRADGLSVIVGDGLRILNDVSFTLPAGSMTAVIGPSGSGKSTLLNALTGQRPADEGRVYLGGRDLYASVEGIGRRIGFVPQDDPVHLTLTVRRALTAAARLRLPSDTSSAEITADVERVAAELGLAERLETRVEALSGGQRKRVSVGYELVGEPQALILDEPTSGLDPGLERELMGSLRQLSDKGTTTIVVTHSVQSVQLCDQVLVLAPGGLLAFIGSADKVAGHFGVPDIESVFSILSSRPEAEWAAHFARTSSYRRFVAQPASPTVEEPQAMGRRPFFADLRVLTGRYLRTLLGDRRRLALLVLQAPVLALLFSVLVQREAFSLDAAPTSATREYLLATILVMTWIGGSNSVRELVDERSVFRREKAVGVSTSAWVLSKWLVLGAITTVQAIVLHLIASSRQLDAIGDGVVLGSGQFEFIVALAGIGIACVGLGLLISALVSDSARALSALPLVAVSVLLLSGLVVPTAGRPGVEQVTYLNPVQWGGSAAAVTTDLQTADGCFVAPAAPAGAASQDGAAQPAPSGPASCDNARWDRAASTQTLNLVMLAALSLLLLAAAAMGAGWSLSRPLDR